jgi:polyisoprenoid-binding protein YceI
MLPSLLTLACIAAPVTRGPLPAAQADTNEAALEWRIDPAQSELTFKIRHLVTRVTGTFTEWQGSIHGDPADWASGSVRVQIQASSIDTENPRRDADLRSSDFFDAEKYPELSFTSNAVEVDGERITIHGDLTIKGITRPVTLSGSYLGITAGTDGRVRVGFEASTTINRLDYGVSWNTAVEGGGMLLGDEVFIEMTIAAIRTGGTS